MPNFKRALRYIAAIDVMNDHYMRAAAVYFEHGFDPNDTHPFDGSLQMAGEVLSVQFTGLAKAAGAIMLRVSGMDAAYRREAQVDFPE